MGVVNMLKALVRWSSISTFSKDNQSFPLHQVTYMGKSADAVAWYPFGYHANPGKDALCLMFAVDADPENRVMFPGSPQDRIDPLLPTPLKEGEVLIFHPETKSFIHFLKDGTIDIDSKKDVNIRVIGNMLADVTGKATIDATGTIELNGNTLVDIIASAIEAGNGGSVESLCNEAFLAKFNSHSHASAGANDTVAVIGTDTTSVLKGE
jgi:hypothetical protein